MLCKVLKKEIIKGKAEDVYDISVEKYHNFILDNGAVVHNCDTFNSAPILQELKADGFHTEIVSVDRVDPRTKVQAQYAYFKSAMYERRLELYSKCELLTEEILQLERLGNGKIEHQDAGKHGSKDQCDALVGSLWDASRFAEEYSYSYGDNLNAALDANAGYLDDAYNKQQLVLNFEEELKKINFKHMGYSDEEIANPGYNNKELEYYQDLSDGIIIF